MRWAMAQNPTNQYLSLVESSARVGRIVFVSCATSLNEQKRPMISASKRALGVMPLLMMVVGGSITVYGICNVVCSACF